MGRVVAALFSLALLAPGDAYAAERGRRLKQAASIRVDSRLVLIPVTVTDPAGATVPGLPPGAFRLFDGGAEQEIKYFSADDAPVSLGVVFDASRSMEGRLDRSREAIARFFETAMPGDEFFLVEFNDRARLLCEFTPDSGQVQQALAGIIPRNWTALLDAVYLAVHQMKRASNPRKALLVLSDGADNYSRYTEGEMRTFLRERDVSVYSIGLGVGLLNRHTRLLRKLADDTGGYVWEVSNSGEIAEAVGKASDAIRNQYVLGYVPNSAGEDGLFRRVQVKLNPAENWPQLRATWRSGYYSTQ